MDKYFEFIKNLLKVVDGLAKIIGIIIPIIIILLIALIIFLIAKKKKKPQEVINEKVEVEKASAETKEEEAKEETKEEEVQEEPQEELLVTEEWTTVETSLEELTTEETSISELIPNGVKVKKPRKPRVLTGKFEVFPVNEIFVYRLSSSNGETLVVSEIYKSLNGALQAVDSIKENIDSGEIQMVKDKHNLWQFRFLAANKRLLAVSANYSSKSACEKAGESFKKIVPNARIVCLENDPEHLMEEIKIVTIPDKKGGRIVINKEDDDYFFQIQASNGSVLCVSNDYKTKSAIKNGIFSFKEAVRVGRFIVVKDKKEMYQYKLYNPNGRCVMLGQTYKNKNLAISAANSLVSYLALAELVDKSGD